jgi:hypothetical protein
MSYDSDVLARATLEHYIPFLETSGAPLDHIGDLVLTPSGAPGVGAASITCDGEPSCSFGASLPGAADFFTLTATGGNAAIINDLTADWTVIAVVEVASYGAENQILIPLTQYAAPTIYIGVTSAGLLFLNNQGSFFNSTSGALAAGTPYHICVRYTATTGRIDYLLDGDPIYYNYIGYAPFANNPPATIPGDQALYGFNGSMAKLAGYSSALSNAVISADATDALCLNPGPARASQVAFDTIGQNADAVVRASQVAFDTIAVLFPPVRVSQVALEVITPNASVPIDDIDATDTASTMSDTPFLHVPHAYTIDESDTAATMSDSPGATPIAFTSITINFIDENGNPFPPLVEASFYNIAASGGAANVLAAAFVGEPSAVSVNLQVGTPYRIEFAGGQAPTTVAFVTPTGPEMTVPVAPYVSPAESQTNYTLSEFFLYVRGWLPTAAAVEGSNAWTFFYAVAALLALLDDATRAIGASERLQASAGAQVDSWAVDFFGNTLPRLPSESDAAYMARIIARFLRPYGTIQAIIDAIDDFFTENPTLRVPVTVFDRQTNPSLAAIYGLTPGQVCIILAYGFDAATGWFLGHGFLGTTTRLANAAGTGGSDTAPYPGLAAAVNSAKLAGSVPVYVSSLT